MAPNYDDLPDDIHDPPMYFDEDANPISLRQWARIMEGDIARWIRQTNIGPFTVWTVFLGIDMGFGRMIDPSFKPLIYETMIFNIEQAGFEALDQWRYPNKTMALAHHDQIVAELKERSHR